MDHGVLEDRKVDLGVGEGADVEAAKGTELDARAGSSAARSSAPTGRCRGTRASAATASALPVPLDSPMEATGGWTAAPARKAARLPERDVDVRADPRIAGDDDAPIGERHLDVDRDGRARDRVARPRDEDDAPAVRVWTRSRRRRRRPRSRGGRVSRRRVPARRAAGGRDEGGGDRDGEGGQGFQGSFCLVHARATHRSGLAIPPRRRLSRCRPGASRASKRHGRVAGPC